MNGSMCKVGCGPSTLAFTIRCSSAIPETTASRKDSSGSSALNSNHSYIKVLFVRDIDADTAKYPESNHPHRFSSGVLVTRTKGERCESEWEWGGLTIQK